MKKAQIIAFSLFVSVIGHAISAADKNQFSSPFKPLETLSPQERVDEFLERKQSNKEYRDFHDQEHERHEADRIQRNKEERDFDLQKRSDALSERSMKIGIASSYYALEGSVLCGAMRMADCWDKKSLKPLRVPPRITPVTSLLGALWTIGLTPLCWDMWNTKQINKKENALKVMQRQRSDELKKAEAVRENELKEAQKTRLDELRKIYG